MLRLAIAVIFTSACLLAQAPSASVSGTVSDSSGAAIAGARLTATQVQTGITSATTTNQSGVYNFPSLGLGRYNLSVTHDGFASQSIQDIALEIGARLSFNFQLEPGKVDTVVEVNAAADALINTVSTSVGGVVTGEKVLNLPVVSRNALNFTTLQAGTSGGNFAGARIGSLNILVDGINVQDNRINSGVFSTSGASVDIIEEFRVVVSPADAEYGRGSGQIQARTRSGTNQFHGSAFELHRNTVLNANTWFNNQRGLDRNGDPISPRNRLVRNEYGGRIGGPIKRNKTFFHFNYEATRQATRAAVNTTVLTASARNGLYRFFPNARNGNSEAAIPTVDLNGNPVRPTGAGELQTVNLFTVDPARSVPDPTGTTRRFVGFTPLPNNFRFGDGLNTAGYTWSRPGLFTAALYRFKLDHNFNSRHRAELSWQRDSDNEVNGFQAQPFPNAPGGTVSSWTHFLSVGVDSTLSPRLLNQVRAGFNRPWVRFNSPWELVGRDALGQQGNSVFFPAFASFTNPLVDQDPQGRISPVYQFGDTLSYTAGKHNLRAGAEVRWVSSNGFNSFSVVPRANIGAGVLSAAPVTNIPLIGVNNTLASSILNDLTGTITNKVQAFNATGGANPQFVPGEPRQRTWRQRELAWFFKDDWKFSRTLTLNLGVRWDYYGVPYEALGRLAALKNGSAGIFGLSGTDFSALFRPGVLNGSLSEVELVGRNSPNPGRSIQKRDWNNFSPAVGLSWQLPKLRRETVFRAGYGWGYERNSIRNLDVFGADIPGLRIVNNFRSSSPMSFANMPILTPPGRPLERVSLDDRAVTMLAWDSGLVNPYIQNFNASLTHRLPGNRFTVDVRYVGSKSTRLYRASNINEANIFENGILDAYLTTQAGGNAPLFDRVFSGLNIAGFGLVDGNGGRTGSAALRFLQPGAFANNNPAVIATYLNSGTLAGVPGSLLTRAGLPQNFVMASPQFGAANLLGNFSNATYHSFQTEVTGNLRRNLDLQANWTWSRAIGDEEGAGQDLLNSYRTNRNRGFDKRLMAFHRTHIFRSNVIYSLPFGQKQRWLANAPRAVDAVLGGWQAGAIYNVFTGQPISFLSSRQSFNAFSGDNNASAAQALDAHLGSVTRLGNGVQYFNDLKIVPDPYRQQLTTTQNIQNSSVLFAITDAAGGLLLRNPAPGFLGNLADNSAYGPSSFRLDVRLSKRFRLTEGKELQFNIDAENATNSPQWNNPTVDINSANFGRITGAGGTRIMAITGRFNF